MPISRRGLERKQLTNKQKRFLRNLVHILADVIDEKPLHQKDDDVDSFDDEESTSGDEIEVDRNKRRSSKSASKNLNALARFLEKHNELSFRIRAMLNTLGGGDRAAKALEKMHDALNKIIQFSASRGHEDGRARLYPVECVEALVAFGETIKGMIVAFQDFGVFGTKFFDRLACLTLKSQGIASKLDAEYGRSTKEVARHLDARLPLDLRGRISDDNYIVDEYLDSLFEPLVVHLELYIHELASISEREITAVQQSQESASQQYLNLPTIATFLSSVTATTLQISTDGDNSTLSTVTNSLWFVSLVCSSASIVYSLLDMSWRRSSIRRPELSLPWLAHAWLRDGPMFTLIAALVTFSIGLCLLAFLVTDQQGSIAPALVPTALAGLNAHVVFFLSAWYIFEHWKTKNSESWVRVRDKYFHDTARSFIERAEETRRHGSCIKRLGSKLVLGICRMALCFRHHAAENNGTFSELELERHVSFLNIDNNFSATFMPIQSLSEQRTDFKSTPGDEPVIPKAVSLTAKSSSNPGGSSHELHQPDTNFKHYEDLIHFSLDCRLLASAFSETVSLYDVGNAFSVMDTLVVPDGGQIRQVSWYLTGKGSPYPAEEQTENLLVRSSRGISTWAVLVRKTSDHQLSASTKLIGRLDGSVGPVRWFHIESSGFVGFSCLLGSNVRLFDIACKELESCDISEILPLTRILDATFLSTDKILCLSTMQSSTDRRSQLFVIDSTTKAVKQRYTMGSNHKHLTVSQLSCRVLIHGGEGETEVIELLDSAEINDHYILRRMPHTHPSKEQVVGFHGKGDSLIYSVTEREIGIFYRPLERQRYCTPLHMITTPSTKATVKDLASFAVGLHPDRALPYLFAFRDGDGSVVIWSTQSNRILEECEAAETFEVHDRRDGRYHPVITMGKCLSLPPHPEHTNVHIEVEDENAIIS